jgi:hypothetical protein
MIPDKVFAGSAGKRFLISFLFWDCGIMSFLIFIINKNRGVSTKAGKPRRMLITASFLEDFL